MRNKSPIAVIMVVLLTTVTVLGGAFIIENSKSYATSTSGARAGISANLCSMWSAAVNGDASDGSMSQNTSAASLGQNNDSISMDGNGEQNVDQNYTSADNSTGADSMASGNSGTNQGGADDGIQLLLMSNTNDSLNVRSQPSVDASLVGKLRPTDVAQIIGGTEGWYQILSGNVTGFVSAEFCITGEEAFKRAEEVIDTVVTSTTGGLKIRSEASTEASVLAVLYEGEKVVKDNGTAEIDGWVPVLAHGANGFVSAEYVTVSIEYSTAITMEEMAAERAAEAAQKAAEEAKKAAEAAKKNNNSSSGSNSTGTTINKPSSTTEQKSAISTAYNDVTILGALIQHEAGSDTYEGKLAVGAVVCNRVRSSSCPNTVVDVIYQKGQFPAAANGGVSNILSRGVSQSCLDAAQAALSGTDNTGGAMYFIAARTGHAGTQIGAHVFW